MWGGVIEPFLPSPDIWPWPEELKNSYFLAQNEASMAGHFQGREPTWKLLCAPYHLPIHGTTFLGPFLPPPGTHPGLGGAKNGYFLG